MATTSRLQHLPPEEELIFLVGSMPTIFDPGTVFLFEEKEEVAGKDKHGDPYVAMLSCPRCGTLQCLTKPYLEGGRRMNCIGGNCSAHFHIEENRIVYHKPQ